MTWEMLQLSQLPGFPLWEKDVHDVLAGNLESLMSIFRAYAAASIEGSATEMDMEEFHDFVIESNLITDAYGFDTMSGQFTKANAGSNDSVLELHEFLTMLVRISFFRANPQYGMRKGKDQKNADKFGDEQPLPYCLSQMLAECVLPNARDESYASDFTEKTLPLPEVQAALAAQAEPLTTFFEEISAGRDFLELDQWIGALESKLLCSDVTIDGFAVRLTEPQARAAFYAACASAESGLTPAELSTCVARAGYDKYKHVTPMGPGAKVGGFLENLFGESDEEDVVVASTGGARPGGSGSGGDAPAAPVEEAAEGGDGAEEEEAAGEED